MILSEFTRLNPKFEAVMCFCFDKNANLILLQKRIDHQFYPGLWGIPAGRVENGEDITDAVMREIREETGNEVPEEMLKLVLETNHKHIIKGGEKVLYFKGYTFVSKMKLEKIILDKKEHVACARLKPYIVPAINIKVMIPDTLRIYELLQRKGELRYHKRSD